jgi:hypothetical protein
MTNNSAQDIHICVKGIDLFLNIPTHGSYDLSQGDDVEVKLELEKIKVYHNGLRYNFFSQQDMEFDANGLHYLWKDRMLTVS